MVISKIVDHQIEQRFNYEIRNEFKSDVNKKIKQKKNT
jgi:hypothetical protein